MLVTIILGFHAPCYQCINTQYQAGLVALIEPDNA